ncbi:MAG: GYD domain-containing protein [Chloroflexota bacterium]|nr:GYD domain-containing protein [Chloroflexota bacterium]
MPSYLYQVGYTAAAWEEQVKHPKNRMEAIRPVIEKMGGKVIAAYYAFGKDDLILIADMPSNETAAAFAIAAAAGGAVTHLRTTPLMTMDEGVAAMKDAAKSTYAPPQ